MYVSPPNAGNRVDHLIRKPPSGSRIGLHVSRILVIINDHNANLFSCKDPFGYSKILNRHALQHFHGSQTVCFIQGGGSR